MALVCTVWKGKTISKSLTQIARMRKKKYINFSSCFHLLLSTRANTKAALDGKYALIICSLPACDSLLEK